MMQISRSSPKGITLLSLPINEGSVSAHCTRLAKLNARTLSAIAFEMILVAPYSPVTLCRTMRTREHPPRPTVEPSCHGPMCVFRRRLELDALVLAFDISESRLGLCGRPPLLITADNRLFSGED
jgi:hypothetical protein